MEHSKIMTQVLESLDWHDIWEKKKKKKHNWMLFFPVTTVARKFLKNKAPSFYSKSVFNFKIFLFLD